MLGLGSYSTAVVIKVSIEDISNNGVTLQIIFDGLHVVCHILKIKHTSHSWSRLWPPISLWSFYVGCLYCFYRLIVFLFFTNNIRLASLSEHFHHLAYSCFVRYLVGFRPRFVKFPEFMPEKISLKFVEIFWWCSHLFFWTYRRYLSDDFQILFRFPKLLLISFSFKLTAFSFSTHHMSIVWLRVFLTTAELQ